MSSDVRFPWSDLVERASLTADDDASIAEGDVGDDLGGDPYDVDGGDVVVNARREVRIVCQAWSAEGGLRFLWLDPATGQVYDDGVDTWSEWAGEQLWFIRDDGQGWRFRSPFDEQHQTNDPKPSEPTP